MPHTHTQTNTHTLIPLSHSNCVQLGCDNRRYHRFLISLGQAPPGFLALASDRLEGGWWEKAGSRLHLSPGPQTIAEPGRCHMLACHCGVFSRSARVRHSRDCTQCARWVMFWHHQLPPPRFHHAPCWGPEKNAVTKAVGETSLFSRQPTRHSSLSHLFKSAARRTRV